jgi:hypothetical protein
MSKDKGFEYNPVPGPEGKKLKSRTGCMDTPVNTPEERQKPGAKENFEFSSSAAKVQSCPRLHEAEKST